MYVFKSGKYMQFELTDFFIQYKSLNFADAFKVVIFQILTILVR